MTYQVRTERKTGTDGPGGTFIILADPAAGTRAAIWVEAGFNCFQWQVPHQSRIVDLLYSNPELLAGGRPTRYGIPVLFPFPNRIRDGRFAWEGKTYQLPLNDGSQQNAIHGFACRQAWRVVDQGADTSGAWVTGEFWGSKDAPAMRSSWPADYRLRLSYRLEAQRLRLDIEIANPDDQPLPVGLGFHPYLAVPLAGGGPDETWMEAPARTAWELVDALPTGARRPVAPGNDLRSRRPVSQLNLDDLLTDLEPVLPPGTGGLYRRGAVGGPGPLVVELLTSAAFRELVVFTPPHRQAVCLEPYTCATDAINLQARGVDAGLRVLPPGGQWSDLKVEFRLGNH
jgi:aldose 1-epimerase